MSERIIAAVFVLGLAACSWSATGGLPTAHTEEDFAAEPGHGLLPGQAAVTVLEALDAATPDTPDTGAPGTDEIPIHAPTTSIQAYGLDPEDDSGTIARVEMRGPDGSVLFTLTPGSPTASATLEPGDYRLVIYSGFTSARGDGGPRAVFLRPSGGTSLLGRSGCQACDLSDTVLVGLSLATGDFASANLCGALLYETNLREARLAGADLSGSNLVHADLSGADLRGAHLDGANLASARLDGATWVDGRVCATPSVGECR
jgi:hypothetical protein